MSITYSPRLGVLSEDQLQRALDRFELGTLRRAEPITAGLFGQNVLLDSTTGAFVLRGAPHSDAQLPHERFFCDMLHAQSAVPVPWPYRIDPTPDIFGWSYAIMPRMPGRQFDDAQRGQLRLEDRCAIARVLGATLAAVAAIPAPACGSFDLELGATRPWPGGLAEVVAAEARALLAHAIVVSPQTINADLPRYQRIIQEGLAHLGDVRPSPTTTDFGESNALVEAVEGSWRCSGIFDFYEWSVGDADRALVRPLHWYLQTCPQAGQAFLQAYAQPQGLRSGARERLSLYVLLDRLIVWNYGHFETDWYPPDLHFRTVGDQALDLISAAISHL